ncbi:MAG: serine/threonine-protein phosphatase [Anaerolineales bacterium]|nr:serine/threonine-protein phosphatase [Anaerolineales bacterium]
MAEDTTSAAIVNNGAVVCLAYAGELNIGRSRQRGALEDRWQVAEVMTAGGLQLLVAIVADGIGGGNYGERAAQLALDTTFEEMRKAKASRPEHIPKLLRLALTRGNAAVCQEAQASRQVRGMGSTATVVAVHDNRLYVANAGDSRAYLVRDGQVIQLTRDHTWAYEMVQLGRLSPEAAATHPKADELTCSIGYEPELTIDLGLFLETDGEQADAAQIAAAAQQNQGLLLRPGDRLVVIHERQLYVAQGVAAALTWCVGRRCSPWPIWPAPSPATCGRCWGLAADWVLWWERCPAGTRCPWSRATTWCCVLMGWWDPGRMAKVPAWTRKRRWRPS